ncbi:hypothetical protein HN51_042909 [Arachis hypogaea]|uniref:Interactor of constitutive active ROPs n=3 Tax=Arachis hypogaea TaxID=3818 RepID=A0A444Y7Z1_ARAHY|nr:interactor of constitutive active ROPs 3 [Arachis ipaensis]XP_016171665.1 interactor of constitutive active ROPs 3 [Arachis ipaensis]XP_025672554.1 interactor of constitutive active ROPs 3 [Arachis hypogaea]RYQ98049.1 hypothetical protein Ahy_B08g094128 [Arachis hypogaea]
MQMQTPNTRNGSSEVSRKVSPRGRGMRQLRPSALYIDSASTLNQVHRTTSKDRSPKVIERRSPRSPAPERKRPSRIPELESQVSHLREDLKKVREQLSLSESCKKQAQQEAEESKQKLFALSLKLEESQQQVLSLTSANLEDSLTSSMIEISHCENSQTQFPESSDLELLNLKQNLAESLCIVKNMKNQLKDCKESSQAEPLVDETLRKLEAAKRTVEFLRADAAKSATEIDPSRTGNSLDSHVSKLATGLISSKIVHNGNLVDDHKHKHEAEKLEKQEGADQIGSEIQFLKSEVEKLRCAMETAETKYHEEQIRSTVHIRNAYELMEQMKLESSKRESQLEAELRRKKAEIEDLKGNLLDKETELQCIVEENEKLNARIEMNLSSQREHENELKMEIQRLHECVAEMKAEMMDKETTLESISEENEILKNMEFNKVLSESVAAEIEAAKAVERVAAVKLGIAMEEADRSNQKAARIAEQLEEAQALKSEMEAELRRLKVQCDQWRKAAETAASLLSTGKGKLTERSLSLDNKYNIPLMNNKYEPCCDDIIIDDDDDFQRKKYGNMLKKIGILWKKPHK